MLWRIMLWLNRKEVENMAVIYVALIVKGKRTYASVPGCSQGTGKGNAH